MSEITKQIKDYCMNLICAEADAALAAAPDYLTDLADQTKYPQDRAIYLDTMHELGFNKKIIVEKFKESMGHSFDALTDEMVVSKEVQKGGIDTSKIFGADDLEEKLALETMTSKARSRTELPLHSVIRSLNSMMGDDWVQHNHNPLDPENVIRAWLDAVNTMQFDPKGNLAMYGLFDANVLYLLPQMYENIGDFLAKLPKARKTAQQEPVKEVETLADYEDEFADIDSSSPAPSYADFDNATESDAPQNFENEGEPSPEIRTDELVQLLDTLQRNRDLDFGEFYGGSYLMDLRGLLEASNATPEGVINPWTIGQINDDVVDMTELLFSFIMEDVHLPEDIRYHLARLQIPYLKLALQDKSIFVNKKHPARELLNDLSQSISLWDPTHSGGLDLLLTETVAVVDKILVEYNTDTRIFGLIHEQFNRFLSGDEHIDEEMQSRKKDTASKTAKADNARLYIESTLDNLCKNKRIPPVINQIIDEFWTKVLFLEFLKGGEDSEAFGEFIKTASMLVDSVQPKATVDSRKAMAKILPSLIKRIKAGFTTISVTSFETVEIFRELQECHMLVLKERPELVEADEFEVSDDEYEEFKQEQNVITDWNRTELENSLLEESIERSLCRSDSDAFAFEDNRNIISGKKDMAHDAAMVKAAREREIIDSELKEARDAYEKALEEHKSKKAKEFPGKTDEDDFMTQFFQDPEFIEKQYAGQRDLSSSDDAHVQQNDETSDEIIDDDIFEELEQVTAFPVQPQPYEIETVKSSNKTSKPIANLPDEKGYVQDDETTKESREHSNDELAERAHGAMEEDKEEGFNELGDEKVTDLIERLKVGLWVDLVHADGEKVRAKIMAIVPTVGKYIFGDRSGHKLADFNKQNLAVAIKTGQIRINEEDRVFDKTLESVIANLRIMKKAEDD